MTLRIGLARALDWVAAALRTHPEETLPDDLTELSEDATAAILQLVEARSWLSQIAATTYTLRRLIDREIADRIGPYGAIRYGDQLLTPATGKSRVDDHDTFWLMVNRALQNVEDPTRLLSDLINPNNIKLRGLATLADALGLDVKTLRSTIITYDEPSSPLQTKPMKDWPMWALRMADGDVHITKANPPG